MASSSPSSPAASSVTPARTGRRRQRSVRVTVAVALLSLATALVVLALPTQSPLWLSLAAVFALASGWAAARIVYTELAQSRREAATDRAAQAQAYRSMFAERASEHAEFTTAMTDRMVRRDRDVAELENSVVEAEKRAIEAEARVQREARRANDAQEKVQELTERVEELEIRKAEEDDELATWHSDLDATSMVELIAWEERVTAGAAAPEAEKKHA
jgi:Skp family chaperone for outer membrane proteins